MDLLTSQILVAIEISSDKRGAVAAEPRLALLFSGTASDVALKAEEYAEHAGTNHALLV